MSAIRVMVREVKDRAEGQILWCSLLCVELIEYTARVDCRDRGQHNETGKDSRLTD